MKESKVPLPLIILFGVSLVAILVLAFVIGPIGGKPPVPVGQVRVTVLAPDGKPRAGVTLILIKNRAERPVIAAPTDAGGNVLIRAVAGRYDVRVYPKKLATRAARAAFRKERRLDAAGLIRHQLMVGNLSIQAGDSVTEARLTLPTAASY